MPGCESIRRLQPREIVRRAQECSAEELAKDPLFGFVVNVIPAILGVLEITLRLSIILNARNKAFKEGYAPDEIYKKASLLFSIVRT